MTQIHRNKKHTMKGTSHTVIDKMRNGTFRVRLVHPTEKDVTVNNVPTRELAEDIDWALQDVADRHNRLASWASDLEDDD